jgi:hypothetical protein
MTVIGWLILAALGAGGALVLLVFALGRVSGRADERTEQSAAEMRERIASGRPPLPPEEGGPTAMALPPEVTDGLAQAPPRFVRGTSVDRAGARRVGGRLHER